MRRDGALLTLAMVPIDGPKASLIYAEKSDKKFSQVESQLMVSPRCKGEKADEDEKEEEEKRKEEEKDKLDLLQFKCKCKLQLL